MRIRDTIVLAAGIVLWASQAVGQTRFTWPDTAVDVSKYSIEACRFVVNRVKRDLVIQRQRQSKVWWDTMPGNPLDSDSEPPNGGQVGWLDDQFDTWLTISLPEAVATAQRCGGGRFTGESAPLMGDSMPVSKDSPIKQPYVNSIPALAANFKGYELFDLYFNLFRDAGADAQVRTYLDRSLQGTPSDSVARRLIEALRLLGYHRKWYPLIEDIILKNAPRVTDRVRRAQLYAYLVPGYGQREQLRIDTATALRQVERFRQFTKDSLTDSEREALVRRLNGEGNQGNDALYLPATFACSRCTNDFDDWARRMNREIRLGRLAQSLARAADSLRKSDSAYFAFWRLPEEGGSSYWQKKADGTDSALVWNSMAESEGVGEKAPSLKATAWAGPPVTEPRPTPGRLSLIVFFAGSSYCSGNGAPDSPEEFRGNCAPYLIPLRRLVDRYPHLDVTVAARTFGHFANIVDSVTPAKEAELTYQALVGYGIKRVPVAMYDMPFVRLPEPDGRIMQRSGDDFNMGVYLGRGSREVMGNYPLEFTSGMVAHGNAYLVDENGIIVYTINLANRGRYEEFDGILKALLDRTHSEP